MNAPTGATGATGPTGPAVTSTALSAINNSAQPIFVQPAGTAIPLPLQPYNTGFTVNSGSTVFTAEESGSYYVSYKVKTTLEILLSSAVFLNGVAIPASVNSPVASISGFSADFITALNAGDTLQLVLYGVLETISLVGGAGASLNIIEIA